MKNFRQSRIEGNLRVRAEVLSAVRGFFAAEGYLEVETPVRVPTQAPEAHIDPEAADGWFLQTSPEICMKRLLAAGYRKIFQICKCFRKGERGRRHLPEITLLEWYRAGVDYTCLMDETERLVRHVAERLGRGAILAWQGRKISLLPPWEKLSVREAFDRYASISPERAIQEDRFEEILAFQIEPHLGTEKPFFLYDYPVQMGALARRKPGAPGIAERFELYIAGIELCNAFSELIDGIEQRKRFEMEIADRKTAGKTAGPMPEKFLESMQHMPEAAGCALGIDRLAMLFADVDRICDMVAFSQEEL